MTLIVAEPGRTSRRSTVLRTMSIALIGVPVAGAAWSTARLVDDQVHGSSGTNSAPARLRASGCVGARRMPTIPALAFSQQLNPPVCADHRRPRYIDYLAFSPTDVMPLAPWAKAAMGLQPLVSPILVGLVVARAVDVLACRRPAARPQSSPAPPGR
ncbi:hypothetical protein [Streptomyces sp. TLI_171]|uniref:hypothetical protein n=1 Tax=Streptomyces sp. TLI_171 TaxID=1938859 RepID=UPI000C4FB51F|nr:hypothetical protein [Streptomyces sp. TLI_171]RKE23633.1 hypothetical protein BX266_7119 [Streptomyces sp. TLI_171]